MIRKFKNGNIRMKAEVGQGFYSFVHNEMLWDDLYIQQINGYSYIVDFNTGLVYDIPITYMLRGTDSFINDLYKGVKLFPYSKKESALLLQDLENGY